MPSGRIELPTPSLPMTCSTTELRRLREPAEISKAVSPLPENTSFFTGRDPAIAPKRMQGEEPGFAGVESRAEHDITKVGVTSVGRVASCGADPAIGPTRAIE